MNTNMNVNLFWEHNVKCEFCEATFDTQDTLKQHLRLHSRRKPYKCDDCGAKFSYNSTLEWHKKSHTGEMPFKCDECGAQFLQNSMLVWHKRKHRIGESSQSPAIVVNMANIYHQQSVQNFSNMFNLPGLMTATNSVASGTASLSVCTEASGTNTTPNSHIYTSVPTHVNATASSSCGILSDLLGKRKLDGEEGTFRCDICGSVFMHSASLKSHMQNKHNMGDNNPFHILARQQETSGQIIPRKKIILEKPFKCDLCGAGFNTNGHLKSHRQKHIIDRPYKCEKCGLTFSDKSILESHERRHQAERPYKCDRCGAAFFRESHLQRHLKRHTGELV